MKKIFLILGILILITSFVFLKFNIFSFPSNLVRSVSNNITANLNSISSYANEKISIISNISTISKENELLKKENQDLIYKVNSITEKYKENEIINDSIDFVKNHNYQFAKILTIDKEINNTITINIGEKDGVKVGYPVVFKNGFIIGKIKKVERNTSIVLLTIDKSSEIAATVSGYDHSIGIINGNYGLNFKFNYVSIKEPVKLKDLVVTSGIEDNIPSGLIIGEVSKIDYKPSDFFQNIIVTPVVPFENFRVVSVIMPD